MSDEPKKLKLDSTKVETTIGKTCKHWVKRKKRFCKMTVAKGREYCGEHLQPPKALEQNQNVSTDDNDPNARIPCPLDPKHTVYRKSLRKHLKICNARPKDDEPAYVQKGINAGDEETESTDFNEIRLSDLSEQEMLEIRTKVEKIYGNYVEGKIEISKAQSNCLNEELSKEEYGKETRKHLLQAAALIGILEEEEQLKDETSLIEFGAGKGQLAFYLAQILKEKKNSQVILLDRMSLRHKKDNKIEDRSLVHRIRVDIADFKISGLDLLEKSKRIVGISKHLCGAATDLTLRCITQEENPQINFVMIALCCHHRCDWKTFVGKDFFVEQNISQREFVIITKLVSWAICGTGMSRERRREMEKNSTNLERMENKDEGQRIERERLGFMCKRILDYARLDFLKKHNYDACLMEYVTKDVTLENVCLLARKKCYTKSDTAKES